MHAILCVTEGLKKVTSENVFISVWYMFQILSVD